MSGNSIITSLLDQDLYKITMGQSALHQFSSVQVRYKLKCRNSIKLGQYVDEINSEIDALCELTFNNAELEFIQSLPFIKTDYVEFLRLFKLNRSHILVERLGDDIIISTDGPWFTDIYFEVFVIAIVEEVYTRNTYPNHDMGKAIDLLHDKISTVKRVSKIRKFTFSLD